MGDLPFNGKTKWILGGTGLLGMIGTIMAVAVSNGREMATMNQRIADLEKDRDDKKPLIERYLKLEMQVEYNRSRIAAIEQKLKP